MKQRSNTLRNKESEDNEKQLGPEAISEDFLEIAQGLDEELVERAYEFLGSC